MLLLGAREKRGVFLNSEGPAWLPGGRGGMGSVPPPRPSPSCMQWQGTAVCG